MRKIILLFATTWMNLKGIMPDSKMQILYDFKTPNFQKWEKAGGYQGWRAGELGRYW